MIDEAEPQLKPVKLSWNPPEPGEVVRGYKVYILSASGAFQQTIDVGDKTTFETVLPVGDQYFFTVTAYNRAGESGAAPFLPYNPSTPSS